MYFMKLDVGNIFYVWDLTSFYDGWYIKTNRETSNHAHCFNDLFTNTISFRTNCKVIKV